MGAPLIPAKYSQTIDQVDQHVYIGGYLAAADPAVVRQIGVTHILKLFPDDPSYPGGYHRHPGVEYLVINADDCIGFPLDRYFCACIRFIRQALRHRGGRILVHCHAGISRSATIVLLHLMINSSLTLDTALAVLKRARPAVSPNPGFWRMLEALPRPYTRGPPVAGLDTRPRSHAP